MSLIGSFQIPTTALDLFIRSVEISSYIPGRVRLHSKKLVNNPDLEQQVKAQLGAFAELDEIETSTVTGSILIKYKPEQLQKNAELRKVEDYIKMNARMK